MANHFGFTVEGLKKKVVFLDIDGTLCDEAGNIPISAQTAIQKAWANGHQFFYCTGRCRAEITGLLRELPVSGMICSSGGYCEVEGEVLFHKVLEKETLLPLLHYFRETGIAYYLESARGLFASPSLKQRLKESILRERPEEGEQLIQDIQPFMDLLIEDERKIDYGQVDKVCFINHTVPFEEIHAEFHGTFEVMRSSVAIYGQNSGEIGSKNVHKQTAIERLLCHLNTDKSDALALGDGLNDVPMFAAVGTGIAMGNACEELLAIADEVTTSYHADGIALALEKQGLI